MRPGQLAPRRDPEPWASRYSVSSRSMAQPRFAHDTSAHGFAEGRGGRAKDSEVFCPRQRRVEELLRQKSATAGRRQHQERVGVFRALALMDGDREAELVAWQA